MKIFIICLIAWAIAQLLKVIINLITYYYKKSKGETYKKVNYDY